MTFYRALLRLYPAAFREEYGQQMHLVFAQQFREATRARQAALWTQAVVDALTIAPREHLHVIFQDLRYALRTIAARPSFAAVAIFSLALGIGANTALFGLWNGVLHSALPGVRHPEELAILTNPGTAGAWHGNVTGDRDWLSYPEFEDLRDHAQSFSGLMASQSGLATWQVRIPGSDWEAAQERLVSGGYFQVLGVSPALGRLFTLEDDRTALPHAVISYGYWQRRFGGRADVIGKNIAISTLHALYSPSIEPRTTVAIIGITPRAFIGETAGQQPDIWLPLQMQHAIVPAVDWLHDSPPEKIIWLHVFGRLKPGVTLARAGLEANRIFKTGLESFYGSVPSPQRHRELLNQSLKLQAGARGASEIRSDFSTSLTALLAAVGLLLLIACVNLASLHLARGEARRPEIALRLSLGASRGRLIRQIVTESLLLAALGAIAGLAVAYFLHTALVRMIAQSDKTFAMSFTLNPLVLAFTLLITLAAALLFGVAPAWQATKTDTGVALKERGRVQWGRKLVSLQLAFSLPLLAGAGLLARTLYNLQHADLGYRAENLHLVRIIAGQNQPHLLSNLLDHLRQTPGVSAASYSVLGLFSGGESTSTIVVDGNTHIESALDRVGPAYFSTLGIPITMGREINEHDLPGAAKVCVVNQAFAQRYFPDQNPIGKQVTSLDEGARRTEYRIVGVAANARTHSLRDAIQPRYFITQTQDLAPLDMPTFLIRSNSDVLPGLRRAFPTLTIDSAQTLEEEIASLTSQDRTTAQLAIAFGSVALTLSAIGLYGLLSYGIARRQREIAIRIAVGAQPGRVVTMILRETARVILVGLGSGACLTYGASLLVNSRLYGVAPQDPLTLISATVLLLLVALTAASLPARTAAKLNPMEALRRPD